MIRYTSGNLLESDAEALVNTVNEVGVMGKGIALMFSEAFPETSCAYAEACERGEVKVGRVFVTENHTLAGPRWIIHFPTKRHWRHPSQLAWVREGLQDLARVVAEKDIRSIAVPPLGCGQGGLDWSQVRSEIESALGKLPNVEVMVYEPVATYQNAPKRTGVLALTIPRALIAEMVRRYSVLGLSCSNLEVQKLAWFLQRAIRRLGLADQLKLSFTANRYGPYADNLRHLLDGLDGSYLHCEKRLADAGPLDLIWFEDSKRKEVDAYLDSPDAAAYRPAMEEASCIIDGFESPLGMELLATVDWLFDQERCSPDVPSVRAALDKWPGGKTAARRKQQLFDDKMLSLAIERLAPVARMKAA
jgi:O-acetyl-ADP-ribose deacetylase (regulator of RNase III)